MNRRELFSSLAFKKQESVIRHHYYKDDIFLNEFISCEGLCKDVCPTNIIFIQKNKTPALNFEHAGCTYCDECAIVCPTQALSLEFKHTIKAKITINTEKCLSWNRTMCFSCKDPCLDTAIDFLALFKPSINDNCTSCGYCIKACPTGAIEISTLNE